MKYPTSHTIASTGRAYDLCQCDETMSDGDIIVVTAEGVIGLVGTWPIAITAARGELHSADSDPRGWTGRDAMPAVIRHIDAALEMARTRGWPLAAWAVST